MLTRWGKSVGKISSIIQDSVGKISKIIYFMGVRTCRRCLKLKTWSNLKKVPGEHVLNVKKSTRISKKNQNLLIYVILVCVAWSVNVQSNSLTEVRRKNIDLDNWTKLDCFEFYSYRSLFPNQNQRSLFLIRIRREWLLEKDFN